MRRFDKLKTIRKANLLTEERYLESKGLINEEDIKSVGDSVKDENGNEHEIVGVYDYSYRFKFPIYKTSNNNVEFLYALVYKNKTQFPNEVTISMEKELNKKNKELSDWAKSKNAWYLNMGYSLTPTQPKEKKTTYTYFIKPSSFPKDKQVFFDLINSNYKISDLKNEKLYTEINPSNVKDLINLIESHPDWYMFYIKGTDIIYISDGDYDNVVDIMEKNNMNPENFSLNQIIKLSDIKIASKKTY